MQLETDYVDKECGCRDFHQPYHSTGINYVMKKSYRYLDNIQI